MKRILLAITAIALAFLLLRVFAIGVVYVQSNSMQPLITKNDGLLINKLAFGLHHPWREEPLFTWNAPGRGEMVAFNNPFDNGHLWLKRVVGLPGDILIFKDHKLMLNGKVISGFDENNYETISVDDNTVKNYRVWSSYLEEDWGPVTVPAGMLFVMGDHRSASIDSRVWGPVPQSSLRGTVLLRFWPYDALTFFEGEEP